MNLFFMGATTGAKMFAGITLQWIYELTESTRVKIRASDLQYFYSLFALSINYSARFLF